MAKIINITDKLEQREAMERFVALMDIADRQIEEILAAPISHLNAAAEEISRLKEIIKNGQAALTGVNEMMVATDDAPITPNEPIGVVAFRRNQAALEILKQ